MFLKGKKYKGNTHNNLHLSSLHDTMAETGRRELLNSPNKIEYMKQIHRRSRILPDLLRSGKVTNPDGPFTDWIFLAHQYFDSDNSGICANFVGNGIDAAFTSMAKYLRENNRIALLAVFPFSTSRLSFIVDRSIRPPSIKFPLQSSSRFTRGLQSHSLYANADVYLGYLGWGAESLDETFVPPPPPPPHLNELR